jgi:broad specificity phosphatase PhoE
MHTIESTLRRLAPADKPRIIIMRHSERLDFVLQNPDWPAEAFINGVYTPYTRQLLTVLPHRDDPYDHVLDTPLTRYGKAHAHRTGEFFRSLNLVPDQAYTSPAMRCIQTADAVLHGCGVRRNAPLKIDLALHEPIRRELPIQSPNYYASAGFNVDLHYRPLLPSNDSRLILGESRLEYYQRTYHVLKRITDRLINKGKKAAPSTTLIVTHRAGVTLLASMLNLDGIDDKVTYLNELESNKRNEVNFLSMIVAEYDAAIGLWTFISDFAEVSPTRRSRIFH